MASTTSGGLDELSRTLRQLREAAGPGGRKLTLQAAAAASGFSVSKVNRIERGRTIPTPADAAALARAYGADRATAERVRELSRVASAYFRRVVLSREEREDFQRRLGEIERSSALVREFSPILVPGLLQTADYMRAMRASTGADRTVVEAFVAARLDRQRIVGDPNHQVTIITTEGALGWAAGPPAMMAAQVAHIARVAAQGVTRVGIIPFGTPADVWPVSSWTLYDERAVCPGILGRQTILHEPDVGAYVEQFEQLQPLAAFGDAALAILDEVTARYGRAA